MKIASKMNFYQTVFMIHDHDTITQCVSDTQGSNAGAEHRSEAEPGEARPRAYTRGHAHDKTQLIIDNRNILFDRLECIQMRLFMNIPDLHHLRRKAMTVQTTGWLWKRSLLPIGKGLWKTLLYTQRQGCGLQMAQGCRSVFCILSFIYSTHQFQQY